MSGTVTAVLFDVDGTLVDSDYLRACKERGPRVVLASSAGAREFAALPGSLIGGPRQ